MLVLQDCLQLGTISAGDFFHPRVPHLAAAQTIMAWCAGAVPTRGSGHREPDTCLWATWGKWPSAAKGHTAWLQRNKLNMRPAVGIGSDRAHLDIIHALETECEIQAAAAAAAEAQMYSFHPRTVNFQSASSGVLHTWVVHPRNDNIFSGTTQTSQRFPRLERSNQSNHMPVPRGWIMRKVGEAVFIPSSTSAFN